jgi:hypothetical protein
MAMLALESSDVIGLRMVRMAGGGDIAAKELQLMIAEKLDAGFEANATLLRGGTADAVVDRYRQHVTDNARRLSR